MSRLNGPIFTVLALIAACGGKVLTDSNGGGDQGGPAGSTVTVTSGTTVGGGGSPYPGTGGVNATAGYYGVGGTSFGVGGASFGVGGFYGGTAGVANAVRCGPNFCAPRAVCCNAQCGVCVPQGAGCPVVSCGTAGGFGTGTGGAFGSGGAGGCGSLDSCIGRFPPPLPCPMESGCLCMSCLCQANTCINDPGCQQILQCSLKYNCRGKDCYAPQLCQAIMDKYGGNSMNLALQLDQCRSGSRCDSQCAVAVDAGAACGSPPTPVGPPTCSGQADPNTCYQQCNDSNMNTYTTKCSGSSCTCYYNGRLTCSCINPPGFACGACCPGFPR